jgi:hypothetical protein
MVLVPLIFIEKMRRMNSRPKISSQRQEFPYFHEDEPEEWLVQCEYIFKLNQTLEEQKIIQTVATFRSEARS